MRTLAKKRRSAQRRPPKKATHRRRGPHRADAAPKQPAAQRHTVRHLPAGLASGEAASDWAAARGLVAVTYRGPKGAIRGIALEADAAARALEVRARRLLAVAEASLTV